MDLYKNLAHRQNNGPKFQKFTEIKDLKILHDRDFASDCLTKSFITRSNLKTQCSSFGFSHIFMGFKNHVFQLKLSDHVFKDPIYPLYFTGNIDVSTVVHRKPRKKYRPVYDMPHLTQFDPL